jgi:hypothetical protein
VAQNIENTANKYGSRNTSVTNRGHSKVFPATFGYFCNLWDTSEGNMS